jgi:glycerate dehydrogenase
MKHSIVFLDRGTLGAELRAPGFPHSYQEYAATPAQLVAERLRDATIAIINKVPMPAETLAQLPKLRLIAVAATGTDRRQGLLPSERHHRRQHSRLLLQHGA